eukprot:c19717_g1_i1.p1 GENE.c19717_g1_i1~~c19717_g1_i1.p1  ORF type:complete len:185 (+),score=33.24 c19717_g1_i1:589-1143(+)
MTDPSQRQRFEIVLIRQALEHDPPHIMVGTPGRVLALMRAMDGAKSSFTSKKIKHFVLDECDKLLSVLGALQKKKLQHCVKLLRTPEMRADVQEIFKRTGPNKQVMMLSATMAQNIRPVIRMFCHNVRPLSIHGTCDKDENVSSNAISLDTHSVLFADTLFTLNWTKAPILPRELGSRRLKMKA